MSKTNSWKEQLASKIGGALAKALTPTKMVMNIKGGGDFNADDEDKTDGLMEQTKTHVRSGRIEMDMTITIELEY